MRTSASIITALLLVAVGLWMLVSTGEEDDEGLAGPGNRPAVEEASPGDAIESAPPPIVAEEEPDDRGELEGTTADTTRGFERCPEDGVEVIVIHEGSDESVPYAEVWFLDGAEYLEADWYESTRDWIAWESIVRRRARHFRADSDGRLRVPGFKDFVFLLATGTGAWGCLFAEPGVEVPITIHVESDDPLRVRVRDEDGNAVARVRVGLGADRWSWVFMETSSPEGIAEFPHLRGTARLLDVADLRANACVPLASPIGQNIPDEWSSADVLDLTIPATASVEVRVFDESGRAPLVPYYVNIQTLRKGRPARYDEEGRFREAEPPYYGLFLPDSRRTDAMGRVLFEHVALAEGMALVAGRTTDPDEELLIRETAGPRTPGQRLQVELRAPTPTVLVASLLDDRNRPFADRSILARIRRTEAEELPRSGISLDLAWDDDTIGRYGTDESGTLRIPLDDDYEPAPHHTLVLLGLDTRGHPPFHASVDLPEKLVPGLVDLGVVVCRVPKLVASGQVLTWDGMPARGATVRFFDGGRPVDHESDNLEIRQGDGFLANVDIQGRFTLHGWPVDGEVVLIADDSVEPRPAIARVPVGATDVELVLFGTGEIRGEILADEGVLYSLSVWARPFSNGGVDPRGDYYSGDIDEREGTFSIDRMPPGRYSVMAGTFGDPALEQVDDVVVAPGTTAEDHRLRFDVRGRVNTFVLDVVDTDGEPIEHFEKRYWSPDVERPLPVHSGGGAIVTTHDVVDVVVAAEGYRTKEVRGVCSRTTVVLEDGILLWITLKNPRSAPDLPHFLVARLEKERGPSYYHSLRRGFGPTGQVGFRVGESGTYALELGVEVHGYWEEDLAGAFTPYRLEVRDTTESQVFEIDLDPQAVREAIERVESDR